MKPEAFVSGIQSAIDENVAIYARLFATAETATDEYWIAAKRFFDSLSSTDRQLVLRIMRQVAIDTVSTMFGILDGTSPMPGGLEDFKLTHKATRLNGDLQDLFLEAVEEAG
jgi:predicted RNA polymerase sigma factor